MHDFVLVRHENGIVAPVARSFAEARKLEIVEGAALRPNGKPLRPVRENGRPPKPKTSVAKKAAEKKAVVPSEGAAEPALTDTTKEN